MREKEVLFEGEGSRRPQMDMCSPIGRAEHIHVSLPADRECGHLALQGLGPELRPG